LLPPEGGGQLSSGKELTADFASNILYNWNTLHS